jgi:predicted RNA-binding Zn-ribbon protein involved in translation (DUF1610 family)
MACMEHECRSCGTYIANNDTHADCPKCGEEMVSTFDERNDHNDHDAEDRWRVDNEGMFV